ncbi:MAG TPA: hypothetical protein VLF18_00745 [Tahibacter sp.]|uniref:hypothetical protein n=1 Tax=Tahibacter sp. TaxID=2056211 RepID=UPI002C5ACDCA|nr:hypothetical protein [Tahibacter sp.]HSX58701.1 hypothetical protein [Tahibacter sp.]
MLTFSRSLILLLGLAFLAGASHADEYLLGNPAPGGVALAQSRQDCDIQPGGNARVIYHDGQSAPVSVPVDARGTVGEENVATVPGGDNAPSSSLPSVDAVTPPKPRGGGLRWQSVLPGSIK